MALYTWLLSGICAATVFASMPQALAQSIEPLPRTPPQIATDAALNMVAPDLDDLWIIDLRLRGRNVVMSDVLAYGEGGGQTLFVPLLQLADTLDFVFEHDAENGKISGWFLRENQRFDLDSPSGKGVVAGRAIALPPHLIFTDGGDVYVPLSAVSDWFALGATWVRDQQYVSLSPAYLLPAEEAAKRGQGRSVGARGPDLDVYALPRASDDYRWFSWPHSTTTLSVNTQSIRGRADSGINAVDGNNVDGNDSVTVQGSTILRGDFLKLNGDLFASISSEGFSQARLRLGRVDPDSALFGPLKASQFEVGDIALSAAPLLQRAASGVGLRIAREPLDISGNFDTTFIQGNALAGWQAELYRDNELLTFQTIGPNGQYRFADVPLIFGANRFRVELFGPQGQQETVLKTVDVDASLIKPGALNYSFEILDAGRGLLTGRDRLGFDTDDVDAVQNRASVFGQGQSAQFVVGYGLNQNVAVRGTASWQSGEGFENDLAPNPNVESVAGDGDVYLGGLGATVSVGGGVFNIDALSDQDGAVAHRVSYATAVRGVSVIIDREDFTEGFRSDANRLDDQRQIRSRSAVRADARVPFAGLSSPLGLGASYSRIVRSDGGVSESARVRASAVLSKVSASHTVNWQSIRQAAGRQTSARTNRLSGVGTLSGTVGPVRLRSHVDYDIEPELRLRRAGVDATTRWRNWALNGRVQRDFRSDSFDYGLGLSRDFSGIRVGADLRHNARINDTRALFTISFAMDKDPLGAGVRFGDAARSDRGAALVRVFQDYDLDGMLSPDEPVIQATRIRAEPRGRVMAVEGDQPALMIEGLSPKRRAGVAVDRAELEDPFAIAASDGTAFVPRPGVVSIINLPVIESAEAEFLLRDEAGEPLQNQIATLQSCDGQVSYKERAAFDGLVFFQFIKPGCYIFKTDGQDAVEFTVAAGEIYRP